MTQMPLAEGVHLAVRRAALLAAEADGRRSFRPLPGQKPDPLKRRGTLWTFTTQDFRPASTPYDGNDTAQTFQPYVVGYVELEANCSSRAGSPRATRPKLEFGQPDGAAHRSLTPCAPTAPRSSPSRSPLSPTRVQRRLTMSTPRRRRSSGSGCTPSAGLATRPPCEMGADAIQLALADAGVAWKDVQFALRRQLRGGQPGRRRPAGSGSPASRSPTSSTPAPPRPAPSSRPPTPSALGKDDIGIAVGMDKHPRGAFTDDPPSLGAAGVVRRERPVRHHASSSA